MKNSAKAVRVKKLGAIARGLLYSIHAGCIDAAASLLIREYDGGVLSQAWPGLVQQSQAIGRVKRCTNERLQTVTGLRWLWMALLVAPGSGASPASGWPP